jgi:RNA polymerase sigma factor (sigma-70 family)
MPISAIPRSPQLLCQHGEEPGCCSICQPIATLTQQTLSAQLDELLDAARPRLLHLATLSGITDDQIEDVVQETSIEAWRHLENLREPAKFSSWLDGICRNVCRRHLRTRNEQKAREISLLAGEDDRGETTFDLPDPFVIDPHEDLIRQDMQLLLYRALGYLPADTRELVERCYLAEQPQREVALQMGMSIGALELKLYRARQQLSQVLRGDLRVDMQEFGLLLDEDESSGWQQTRYWCWLCGKQRMRAHFTVTSTNRVHLRLRCPDCSQKYDTNIVDSGDVSIDGGSGSRTFRPAFKRVMRAIGDLYSQMIYEKRCTICQSPVRVHLIDNSNSAVSSDLLTILKKLSRNFYVCVECPVCGPSVSDLAGLHIYNDELRTFLLDHSHVITEASTMIAYQGRDAIASRVIDQQTGEAITMITHPQTLHLLATLS